MSEVLNTAFYLPFGRREVTRAAAESALVQDLLCYDVVNLFTDQMSVVAVLGALMGPEALTAALEQGAIGFLHDRQKIAWPQRSGYVGPTPVAYLATMAKGETAGFSQASPRALAQAALRDFAWDDAKKRRIALLVEERTKDFEWPPRNSDAGDNDLTASLISDLTRYREVVVHVKDFPISLSDLNTLISRLRHPRKSPLRATTFGLVSNAIESGWAALDNKTAIPQKQLGLIHLSLAERFIRAQQALPTAVLHTEPIVERILHARATEAATASSGELRLVLEASEVRLPAITSPGDVPYSRLLDARILPAAVAFRRLVTKRDAEGVRTLLQEYLAALHKPLAGQVGFKTARWVIGTLLGEIIGKLPGGSIVASALDAFIVDGEIARRQASYFIDSELRRLTEPERTVRIETRP